MRHDQQLRPAAVKIIGSVKRRSGLSIVARLALAGLISTVAACATTPPPPSPPPPRAITEHAPPSAPSRAEPQVSFELEPRLVRSFRSDGKLVRVDVVRAIGAGSSRPAVVMLHGASGLGSGWLVYPHAEELARRGIDAFVVRYYDGLDGNDGSKSSSALHYRREQIISDAISYIASIPEIDPQRIGVYGMSLGAFHALALGTHDRRIAAIADVMGAMPGQIALSSVTSMPPTLLIHGARDRIVPIERMYEVASRLDDIGASYEVKVYTDQAHNLAGAAHTDSILTVADFFDRRLNGAAQTASAQVPVSARTLTTLSEIKPVITARTQSKSSKTAIKSQPKKGAKDVKVAAKSSATKVAGKPRTAPSKVATAPTRSTTKASGQSASNTNAAGDAKDTKSRQAAVSPPKPQPAATRTKTPVDRNQVAATR